MAQYYNSIKTMKTARIGTILPWGGNGFEGFSVDNIPRGWIVSNGREVDARDYPLLAAHIGTTYGGNIIGDFPNYEVSDTFVLPNITNRCMMDLEPQYLTEEKYQAGQGDILNIQYNNAGDKISDLVVGFGTTAVIPPGYSATADIDFVLEPGVTLTGKYTEMAITDPTFQTSITTLNRKLGINHTPAHSHPGTVQSAQANFFGPQVFTSSQVEVSGRNEHPACSFIASKNNQCDILPSTDTAPNWEFGKSLIAYYGNESYEQTLPTMDRFYNFVSDSGKDYWSQVPAPDWHDGTATRDSPQAVTQTVNFSGSLFTDQFPYEPLKTHANMAWTGLFPKPTVFGNRRNFYGFGSGIYENLIDNPENPAVIFTVDPVTIAPSVTEFDLPAGTDIRTTHTSGAVPNLKTWYQYDKIHPWMMIDGPAFAKGTYITAIERTAGSSDADYVYTISISLPAIGAASGPVKFREGTWPTSMSNFGNNDPNQSGFLSHNHGTFDIQMSRGSLNAPFTYNVDAISIGSVAPDNLNDALNIVVDTDQPSMNIVFLIKAF